MSGAHQRDVSPLRRIYKTSPRLRRFVRDRKDAATYHLARFALWLPRHLSLPRALAAADSFGTMLYLAFPETRRLALEHLALAFPELPPAARESIARGAFRNTARCFVEIAKFDALRQDFAQYVSVTGWEHWETVRQIGRGAIVATGHIGNWELLAAYFAQQGIEIAAVARRINDSRLNQMMVDFRTASGIQTIIRESTSSARDMLRVLRRGGVVALLIDLDTHVPSVSVPFFGRPARTPVAAAALAARRGIPILPCFAQRRPGGGQLFSAVPPILPPGSDDRRRDLIELTARCTRALEAQIRSNPAEWPWWTRRWRRLPIPSLDLDGEIQ